MAFCIPHSYMTPAGISEGGTGKWLLFVKREVVDEVWARILTAVEAGLLGSQAKVSTARPNPNASNPTTHVICVYTENANDEADVMRVREQLRNLGFTGKIAYKTDLATHQGLYKNCGNTRISKYYL